jgi:uncharacterized protein YdiU (UPF0061 family)
MKLDELELNVDYFEFDKSLYDKLEATPLKDPKLVSYSKDACDLIALDYKECESKDFLDFMNGKTLKGSVPYSMAYAGHQFGYYVPQLGDGRAINLGSVNNWHLQTKGSGPTRYSRRGDGRAVLRSSIREFIMSEAMHALDIPTTRALAIIDSDTFAHREWNEESCSIVLRMSPSWIRIGSFEFFAKTYNAKENLEQLANYVISQSYSHLSGLENRYEKMFFELVDITALMLAKWQAYGFMHGVMNTDNFSMAGLTIDYGPYAFMDYFEKNCICNHTDDEGRYSYNNQPSIARWNLLVLAEALEAITNKENLLEYVNSFFPQHEREYLQLMSKRLGLDMDKSSDNNLSLVLELQGALESSNMDYNVFFYNLSKLDSFDDLSSIVDVAIFRDPILQWFDSYKKACENDGSTFTQRQKVMKKVNPKYIIKNYMLQEAIDLANDYDYSLVNELLNIAQNPFDEHPNYERYSFSTPQKESNLRLSCSS